MAYKCVHCSSVYKDDSNEVMNGCSNCKSKFFFYVKEEKLKEILQTKKEEEGFSAEEKDRMEKDIREIIGLKDEDIPVFLDFESIKIIKPGKYMIDLPKIFNINKPRVYSLEDGKYIIDLSAAMKPGKK